MNTFFNYLAVAAFFITASTAHAAWQDDYQKLLTKYVTKSGVKYDEWKNNPADVASLRSVTEIIGSTIPSNHKNEQKAFYINAYNAWILKLVLDQWPTASILPRGEGSFFNKTSIKVGKRPMSLDNLEKNILLKRYRDPRIHFAVNCASKGCPPLSQKVFKAESLDRHLDLLTKNFINSKEGALFNNNQVTVSRIFNWYEKDFKPGHGTIINYINKYRKNPLPQRKLNFREYDWGINVAK